MARKQDRFRKFPALSTLDDTIELLRKRWLSFGSLYLVGSIPFFAYLIYFIEDSSYGIGDNGRTAIQSALLTVLFFWMRTLHTYACQDLNESMTNDPPRKPTAKQFAQVALQQTNVHGFAALYLLLSSLILAPVAWVYGYTQFLCATGTSVSSAKKRKERAWGAAKELSQTLHVFLAIFTVVWGIAWLNCAMLVYFLPELLRMFLGWDNIMSQRGWNPLNTTFLTVSISCSLILVDAIAKAFYTILLHKYESIKSGKDILSKFALPKLTSVALLLSFGLLTANPLQASDQDIPANSSNSQEIEDTIQQVLAQPEFSWRIERSLSTAEVDEEDSLLDSVFHKMVEIKDTVAKQLETFFDWLFNNKEPDHPTRPYQKSGSGDTSWILRLLAFLGIVIAVFLVIWMLVSIGSRKSIEGTLPTDSVSDPKLDDENIHAAQLPTDRWIDLATEKAASGDYRLAMRAMFLASLALLGNRKLVTLAKHKSNSEYAAELAQRGLAPDGRSEFEAFRLGFDQIWYGNYPARESNYARSVEHYKQLNELSER